MFANLLSVIGCVSTQKVNYRVFFECNKENLEPLIKGSKPHKFHVEIRTKLPDANKKDTFLYTQLTSDPIETCQLKFGQRNVSVVKIELEYFGVRHEPGGYPVILQFCGKPLKKVYEKVLGNKNVIFCPFQTTTRGVTNPELLYYIDLKQSEIDVPELLGYIYDYIPCEKRTYQFISPSEISHNEFEGAFILCRRTNTKINQKAYEDCSKCKDYDIFQEFLEKITPQDQKEKCDNIKETVIPEHGKFPSDYFKRVQNESRKRQHF